MPNQHTSPKSNLEEVTSNDTVNPMVADPLKTAAMMEESLENPRTVDEGEFMIPGEVILHMDKIQANVEEKVLVK